MFSPDTIINATFKALGLDPAQMRTQLVALQAWIVESIKNLDSRMRAMESDRQETHAKLDRILAALEGKNATVILEKDENGRATIHAIADQRYERSSDEYRDSGDGTNG